MNQKSITQITNEIELMIEKVLAVKNYNNNPIFNSKLTNLIIELILKTILLKKNRANFESKGLQFNLNQLLENVSKTICYSGEQSKALIETVIKLNKISNDTCTKNIDDVEFVTILRDCFVLITVLSFSNSLINNYDCYIKLIKKIKSFETVTKLADLFEDEWKIIINNDLINKKLSINYPLNIYLDQKDWIMLARVWKDKEQNTKIKKLLHKLILLAYNNKITKIRRKTAIPRPKGRGITHVLPIRRIFELVS